tara:strand:+ start:400 stop:621 length:222 start_codon:yes stop_codon:yes gene_type:complete
MDMTYDTESPELIPGINKLIDHLRELEQKNKVLTEENERYKFKCERLTILYEELDQKNDKIVSLLTEEQKMKL